MSQSSQAISNGFFSFAMRNAAQILFWSSLALWVLTIASYSAPAMLPGEFDGTSPGTRAHLIFDGIVQGLNNAAWPFTGAALVWVLKDRAEGGAK